MESSSAETLTERLSALSGLFDELLPADLSGLSHAELRGLVCEFEVELRRAQAFAVQLVDAVAESKAHDYDGLSTAKKMVQHLGKLSARESASRARSARALRDLPETRAAFESGEIGFDQVNRLARVHANPRVRDQLIAGESKMINRAKTFSYKRFDERVSAWVQQADEDGAADVASAQHENRAFMLEQEYDGGWIAKGRFGQFQGAMLRELLDHFIDLETEIDWDKCRAEHGDDACYDKLARSFDQRSADAFARIFEQGASMPVGSKGRQIVTSVVVDAETLRRSVLTLAGMAVETDDPDRDDYQCRTMNGNYPLNPREAVAALLDGEFRRAIVDATGTVTDVSKKQRMFRGLTRHAALLQHRECTWRCCDVPLRYCQTDHTLDHAKGGQTELDNVNPQCPKHNNLKNAGYSIHRDPDGIWHTYRPDGSEIT